MSLRRLASRIGALTPKSAAHRILAGAIRGLSHLGDRSQTFWFGVILILHLVLSGIYLFSIPMGEAYDEQGHYAYLRYLADYRRLPETTRAESLATPEEDLQFSQPPLYYVLGALATSWIPADPELPLEENPHLFSAGLNRFVHPRGETELFLEEWAVIVGGRVVSVLLSIPAVAATYLIAKDMFPQRRGLSLVAMGITAFIPMFLFMGSIVNNDVAVVAFSSLFFLFATRLAIGPTVRQAALMGASLGLALLSKYNALALMPVAGLVALSVAARGVRSLGRRQLLYGLLAALGTASLAVIWWVVPQSPLAGGPLRRFPDLLDRAISDLRDPVQLVADVVAYLLSPRMVDTFRSFWGVYGWANILMDDAVYAGLGMLVLLSAFGLWRAWRGFAEQQRRAVAIGIFTIATVLFAGIYRELDSEIPVVGRYLLIALSPFSVLFVAGLASFHPRLRLGIAGSLGLFVLALAVPFRYLVPAYALPPISSSDDPPQIETFTHARFGQEIELLGYDLDTSRSAAGGEVKVTLHLRALRPIARDYTMGLHLLDSHYEAVTRINTLPGSGNWSTSLWRVGEIVEDAYTLRIPNEFTSPAQAWLKLTFFLYPGEDHLPVSDGLDRPLGDQLLLGPFPVRGGPQAQPDPDHRLDVRIGDFAQLRGYSLIEMDDPSVLQVYLLWEVLRSPGQDYTVFVHLLDEEGRLVAQHDGPPREGAYPTRFWIGGEVVRDEHGLPLPAGLEAGEYGLAVGMYDPVSLARVPIFNADGHRLADDLIFLEEMRLGD